MGQHVFLLRPANNKSGKKIEQNPVGLFFELLVMGYRGILVEKLKEMDFDSTEKDLFRYGCSTLLNRITKKVNTTFVHLFCALEFNCKDFYQKWFWSLLTIFK